MYQLAEYFQQLQTRGSDFKFYQQEELASDGSADEMEYSKTTTAGKQPAGRARKASRPLPKTCATFDKLVAAEAPVAAAATQPADEEPPASTFSRPTNDALTVVPSASARPTTTFPSATAKSISKMTSQPSDKPVSTANNIPIIVSPGVVAAAATSSPSTVCELPGQMISQSASEPVPVPAPASVASQSAEEQPPAAAPTSVVPTTNTTTAPTAAKQRVAKKPRGRPANPENADNKKSANSKKRKRDSTTGPGVEKELRSMNPQPVIPDAMTARPAKKKKKVIYWRKTRTDRVVPYYELSDWESGDEARPPARDKGGSLNTEPTDL